MCWRHRIICRSWTYLPTTQTIFLGNYTFGSILSSYHLPRSIEHMVQVKLQFHIHMSNHEPRLGLGGASFGLRWIKQVDVKPAGQPEQAGCGLRAVDNQGDVFLCCGEKPKSLVLCMLVRKFLCNVNDTRGLIGLCLLVTSHSGQIRDPWYNQAFTIAHIVMGLSLHVHRFMHLRFGFPSTAGSK